MGLKFLGNTTVTARNPPKLEQAGSYSQLSLYFKTTQSDALLAYMGGQPRPDNKVWLGLRARLMVLGLGLGRFWVLGLGLS